VSVFRQLDSPLKGKPSGGAVIYSDEYPMEQRPPLDSRATSLPQLLSTLNCLGVVETSEARTEEEAQAEFAEALDDLCFAILRATGRGVPGGDTELTLSQYNVLQALGDGPATVSEVAAAADVAVPTATRALRGLERREFVERLRDQSPDGRLVTVSLTGTGARVLGEKRTWVRARQRAIFNSLSDAERESAASLLRVIAADIHEL
jgi:MarR family transcriptional regulator, organic hydroperoxide resistance regulator